VALSSPWDLLLVGRTLFIAMAGPHQIWKLDLETQQISTFAGSGREGNSDGSLSEAAFAQPSGLALLGDTLYVADPEGNIIRGINLSAGTVLTLAGGTRSLFDFGDEDGSGNDVRLQHPLGLARWNDQLFIADTYNHKVKLLNPATRHVKSFAGTGKPGQSDGSRPSFYEPGGLSVTDAKLYVADTNNHAIRVVDLKTKETKTLSIKGLQPPVSNQAATANADVTPNAEEIKLAPQKIHAGDGAITINVELPAGYHLNPTAPQRYQVSVARGGEALTIDPQNANRSMKSLRLPIRVPFGIKSAGPVEIRASFTFVYCREDDTGTCRIKTLVWRVPVEVVADVNAPTEIRLSANVNSN
jgi:DNA-binding beta-propeller fold protein YncE